MLSVKRIKKTVDFVFTSRKRSQLFLAVVSDKITPKVIYISKFVKKFVLAQELDRIQSSYLQMVQ